MLHAIRISGAPVIASHSGAAAVNPHVRNLDDEQLLAIRENGGVVQAVALSDFVKAPAPERNPAIATLRKEFGLATPPLERLATMVRAADTARHELSPEAPGLLAASLGLSRMFDDDLEQLNAGLLLYDAFYRWCRDATKETHNWPTNKVKP